MLELLVVMLIIAVLIGIGAGGYSLARRSAKEGRARAEIEIIRNALEEYRVEYGTYPQAASESAAISNIWTELAPFASDDLQLVDPWGRAYEYAYSNRFQYSIFSLGQDMDTDADNIDPSRAGY